MTRIRVSIDIDAPRRRVWSEVRDLSRHPEWMDDAVAIRFVGDQREGAGTEFDCDTRVGPFRMTDRMQVTSWQDGKGITIRHGGLVTGEGRISLARAARGRTRFTWAERLTFPWWMGGPVAGAAAKPILRRIWRRNLETLARLIEDGRGHKR